MPDDPESNSLFVSSYGDKPTAQVNYSHIEISISGSFPRSHRYYLKKWLKRNRESVTIGEPVAEILGRARGDDAFEAVVVAPASGVLVRDALKANSVIVHSAPLGYIRVRKQVRSDANLPDRKTRQPAALFVPLLAAEPPKLEALHDRIEKGDSSRTDRLSPMQRVGQILKLLPVREPPSEIRAAMQERTTNSHGIFISYRRSDEPASAGRLYDHLVNAFDKSSVFMDVDSIDLGLDFVDVLHDALSKCSAMIVVIGRSWLKAVDEHGLRRLDNPDDFVRLEVEVALERNLRVIPVLVDGASMPKASNLPTSMAPLARRNGREVSNARFGSDTIELINTLRQILGDRD